MRGIVTQSSLANRAPSRRRSARRKSVRLRLARAGAIDSFAARMASRQHRQTLSRRQQAELRSTATYATDTPVEIVRALFRAAGGAALYRSGRLRRCMRDINSGAQHLMVSGSAYERLGQIMLDFPDVDPMG
jgi:alkylation response protein AidB-like acyl-CoA dehydrogenase